jgi:hypothetical protein
MFSDHSTTDYTDITDEVERVVLNAFAKRIAPRAPNLRPSRSNAIVFATSAKAIARQGRSRSTQKRKRREDFSSRRWFLWGQSCLGGYFVPAVK